MNPGEPFPDPEAIALSKVYALLIRVARQRRTPQTQTDGKIDKGNNTPVSIETKASRSRNSAEVAPLIE